MVMGNSHAQHWLEAVDRLANEYAVGGLVIRPLSGAWAKQDEVADFLDLAQEAGVKRVLLSVQYSTAFGLPVRAEEADTVGGGIHEGAERLARGLAETLKAAQERHLELWLVENVPEYEYNVPHVMTLRALKDKSATPSSLGYDVRHYRNRNAPIAAKWPELEARGLKLLPVADVICPQGRCLPGDEGGLYYGDDNHLTKYGAVTFKKVLAPFFEEPPASAPE
jgi:hypothetical protein